MIKTCFFHCAYFLECPHLSGSYSECSIITFHLSLSHAVPTLTITLTANTTHLPNVAPYNTFSFNCTATSNVEGVGGVALPKRFLWLRRYAPPDTTGLTQLSSNATIHIQDGDNLNQPTSSSMLTVTEDIPQDYRYRCQVDLDLPADDIFTLADIYPITVTSKSFLRMCVVLHLCKWMMYKT